MRSDDMDISQEQDDKSNQMSAEDIKSRANDEYKAGRYFDAVRLYTQAIAASPQTATYYSNRAAALTMLKKYKEAAEDCRQATILDPNNVKAFLRGGRCHLNLGNLPESLRQYQTALQLDQSNAVILKEMHLLQNVSNYLQQMEMYMANKQWALALNSLDRAIKMVDAETVPFRWRIFRGEILLGKREFDEAGRIATDVLRLDSQNPDALYFRARVFYAQGENSKAIAHCTEALRCDPDHKDARILLRRARSLETEKEAGNVAFKTGKFQEAYDIYTKALDIDQENEGTNSKLYSNRATVLTKLGRNEEAISDCDNALKLDPNFSKVYVKRATAYMKLENYEEAVKDYKAALERDHSNREIRSQLHEAELALKKSLRKDYYKVLSLPKDCSDADIKKAYRKLALQYHPDKNAGDEKAEIKFKEIGEAYAILSDPQKRQRYDSGVDLDGVSSGFPGGMDVDVNDIFAQFFGGGVGGMGGMGSADFGGFGGFPGGRGRTHSSFHGRPQGFSGTQFHFG